MTDRIAELCAHVGVHGRYRGFDGQAVDVSRDTQIAVLHAMGIAARSDADAQAQLSAMRERDARRPVPSEVIVAVGTPAKVPLAHPATWILEAEGTGQILAEGRARHDLPLPALPLGIHHLRLTAGGQEFSAHVLSRPESAVQLEDRASASRVWGVSGALFGLTDGARTAIGSYPMLGRYAAAVARHGADFFGINPVHAMGQTRPDDVISPYSPSHRGFLNTWHCTGRSAAAGTPAELLDYPAALRQNAAALRAEFAAFRDLPADDPEPRAFAEFAAREGARLREYALFEALSAEHGADWRDWPVPLQTHCRDALAGFEAAHAQDIFFAEWCQWQAERQLAQAQAAARDAGMRIGLYLDLAVGPRLGGAETWGRGSSLVTGATLGAPPDPLGPSGQSWGLAPMSPLACRAEGYAGFARLLRRAMRHAGMIRIDHVLGLMRSFWIPEGHAEGTYVSYPLDALLAVVAIESRRSGTIVVGEDLGLVPEGLRDKLAASGIYGLDVLQYMRTPTGGFVAPDQTRRAAVCGFATHDTPTVAGFLAGEDARQSYDSGAIDADTLARTRADRARARATLGPGDPVPQIHRRLARSRAAMVAIQLDDVAGRLSQQNLPGTVDSYPNWRLKAPFTVNGIETSRAFAALAQDMRAQGRSNPIATEKEDGLQDC